MLAATEESVMEAKDFQLETGVGRLEIRVEHACSGIAQLQTDMRDLRDSMDKKFDAVNVRFDAVDRKFEAMDRRFDAADRKFEAMDRRFDAVDRKFDALNDKHAQIIEKIGDAKVWGLTVIGGGMGFGILAVVARALHWI